MKVSRRIIILFIILSLLIISGCTNSQIEENIEIKGLTPKISLITTAYDVYRVNYKNPTAFNESMYKDGGEYGEMYYNWLKETYSTMDDENKRRLNRIFNGYGCWSFVSELITLDDDANVKDIVDKLNNKSELYPSEMIKEDIEIFFNYFYNEYLEAFIQENNTKIEEHVTEIKSFLEGQNIDIFEFMEKNSKVEFDKDYKAVLYYDLPPIGAMGFENDNSFISTIQAGVSEENLLSAPFHEFSHKLFDTFTGKNEFVKVASKLKNNRELYNGYEAVGKDEYDWFGWCEENLVQGFAEYLDYIYSGKKDSESLYVYDRAFCNYLIENNFSSSDATLEEISIEFYKNYIE